MSFDYWLGVCDKFANGSKAREDALDEMVEFSKTFNEWRNVFFRETQGSILEKTALLQMATTARTFGQWLNVYQECIVGEPVVKAVALTQLMKLSDDPYDADWTKDKEALKLIRWIRVFETSPLESEVELCAVRRIIDLMRANKEKEAKKKVDGSISKI